MGCATGPRETHRFDWRQRAFLVAFLTSFSIVASVRALPVTGRAPAILPWFVDPPDLSALDALKSTRMWVCYAHSNAVQFGLIAAPWPPSHLSFLPGNPLPQPPRLASVEVFLHLEPGFTEFKVLEVAVSNTLAAGCRLIHRSDSPKHELIFES